MAFLSRIKSISRCSVIRTLSLLSVLLLTPSLASANMACYNVSDHGPDGAQTENTIKGQYQAAQDPATDLFGCFMGVTAGGLSAGSVKGGCGCKQAIQQLCSFDIDDREVKASGGAKKAWCAVFAPWAL